MKYVFTLFFILQYSTTLYANQEVTKIYKSKGYAQITQDEEKTYIKGSHVCFYTSSNKRIACGKVRKISKKYAYVKVRNKKRFKKIKIGMTASHYDKKKKSSKNTPNAIGAWSLTYIYTPINPIKNNQLAYNPPRNADVTDHTSLFVKKDDVPTSALGFLVKVDFGIMSSTTMGLGIKYKTFSPFIALSDYYSGQEDPHVESIQNESQLSFVWDFSYHAIFSKTFHWLTTYGFDYTQSDLSYALQKKSTTDGNTEIINAKSTLTLLSLTLGSEMRLFLGDSFSISLGLNALIPVSVMGLNSSITSTDTNELTTGTLTLAEDFENSLEHSANSYGLEVLIGASLFL